MATYYVGPGGNDGNSGLTWALRKLTLNGAEDIPVAAGDTVYVGPGVYREQLTVDVSGGAGTEIVYVGDVTGEDTDSVGGIVRITGSDNDQTEARDYCVTANGPDYRIFRGFALDTVNRDLIGVENCDHWTIEDCCFQGALEMGVDMLDGTDWTIRRCVFLIVRYHHIYLHTAVPVDNSGHLVENCMFMVTVGQCIIISAYGDSIVRNCTFLGSCNHMVWVNVSPNAAHPITVENCILVGSEGSALRALALGDLVENFNTFNYNVGNRLNVAVGANSQTYPPLFLPPILHAGASQASGFMFPWWLGKLSEWSQIQAITGNNEPVVDLHGIARPATAAKNSWGAVQFMDKERETGTVHADSVSMVLHDAGRVQIFVPVTSESTVISVYVYREANYAGGNPQMIIKQPGQIDDVTIDAGAAGAWNQLTTTFTPAAIPPYVVVELVSRNTAAAGNYDTFFDDLVVN